MPTHLFPTANFFSGCSQPRRAVIGAEALGGFGWGNLDVRGVEAAIELACDRGFTVFDTADCYGQGEGENRLGACLATRRHNVAIATKFGVRFTNQGETYYDNSPAYMKLALEASLRRLNTSYIDLYQLHWPDGKTPLEDVFGQLERFVEDGLIRGYGVTNTSLATLSNKGQLSGLKTFSYEYSLAARDREAEIKTTGNDLGLTFLSWGTLAQGMLSGKYKGAAAFPNNDRRVQVRWKNFHGAQLNRNLRIVEEMRAIADEIGAPSLPALAIAWVSACISGAIPIVGVKTCQQVDMLVSALEFEPSDDVISRLDRVSKPIAKSTSAHV